MDMEDTPPPGETPGDSAGPMRSIHQPPYSELSMEVDDVEDAVPDHSLPILALPPPSLTRDFSNLLDAVPSSLSSLFDHIHNTITFVIAYPVYSHLLVNYAYGDVSVLSNILVKPPLRLSAYVGLRGIDSPDWREWNAARCFELMDRYFLTAFEDLYTAQTDSLSEPSYFSPRDRWASRNSSQARVGASIRKRSKSVRDTLGALRAVFVERKKKQRTAAGCGGGRWAHPESRSREEWEGVLRDLGIILSSQKLLDKPEWAESADGWIGAVEARKMIVSLSFSP
jgi:hypothetical protein